MIENMGILLVCVAIGTFLGVWSGIYLLEAIDGYDWSWPFRKRK